MRAIARISKYNENGRIRAKLYLPAKAFSTLGRGEVMISYRGEVFKSSASEVSSGVRAGKVYLPQCICDKLLEEGAEGAVVEVGKGVVEILQTVKFCRICGEPTISPDGLCQKPHFSQGGLCVRCGKRLPENGSEQEALCDDCIRAYALLCGLSEWLEPSPGSSLPLEWKRENMRKNCIRSELDELALHEA